MRRTYVAAAALGIAGVIALSGCGQSDDSDAGAAIRGNGVALNGGGANGGKQQGLPTPQAIPSQLIGSWSGGNSDGFRSSVYTLRGDGTYTKDILGGVRVDGRYVVTGNVITWFYDQRPGVYITSQWYVAPNGWLYLDGESFLPYR